MYDGAKELNKGMKKFDKEAVDKLKDTVDGDIQSVLDRLDKVLDAGKEYKTFAGTADDKESSVKFVIETAGVSK